MHNYKRARTEFDRSSNDLARFDRHRMRGAGVDNFVLQKAIPGVKIEDTDGLDGATRHCNP